MNIEDRYHEGELDKKPSRPNNRPMTIEDIVQAAELVREHNLDYEDAVHLATTLRDKE